MLIYGLGQGFEPANLRLAILLTAVKPPRGERLDIPLEMVIVVSPVCHVARVPRSDMVRLSVKYLKKYGYMLILIIHCVILDINNIRLIIHDKSSYYFKAFL